MDRSHRIHHSHILWGPDLQIPTPLMLSNSEILRNLHCEHFLSGLPGHRRSRNTGNPGRELGRSLDRNFTVLESFDHDRRLSSCTSSSQNLVSLASNRRSIPSVKTITSDQSKGKGKGFPYSIPSVGPGADPVVQAVSLQVTVSHPPGGRLPLLPDRPAVTSPAAEHHRPLAGTKLYCLVTEAHRCKQLAQGCYAASPPAGFELATC